MKKCGIYAVISIIGLGSLLRVSILRAKENQIDIKSYIGQTYETLPKELEQKGIEIKYGLDREILAILVNCEGYQVNTISVGDPISKIEEIYPNEWINKGEHTIRISYGQESHYGIVTNYIIYVIGEMGEIQSIAVGKTAEFIESSLPISNDEARKLLQGKWQSQGNRVLTFNEELFNDTYMDKIWDKQTYKIIAPNQLMIFRQKEEQDERLILYFWIHENKLYLFTINERGIPIEESIEVFSKI